MVSQADIIILRRVADRGLARAQEREDSEFIDIFQHLLDEIKWIVGEDPFEADDEEDDTH